MARIVYLREGVGPDRMTYGADIPITDLLGWLGDRTTNYTGLEIPTIPTDRLDLTPFRDPNHVFVYVISAEDISLLGQRGYYMLEGVSLIEAAEWR